MTKIGMNSCETLEHNKCELHVMSKMIKIHFYIVERTSNLLDLIHSDICELNGMLTRGGNKQFKNIHKMIILGFVIST